MNHLLFTSTVVVCGLAWNVAAAETPEEAAARIAKFEAIAEHALVAPIPNTSPLPQYGYDRLDYGMTIGIERTPRGRLWACWVAGGDSPKAFFVLASSDDDGETWSPPRMVLDSHDALLPRERSILVGNLWTDPAGRLWLFFDQSMDMFDGRAGVWATVCDNPDGDEPAWSSPQRIWHGVTLNKPTVLSSGEWMLPISLDQRGGFGPFRGCFAELDPLRGANVFVSRDQGKSWQRRGAAVFPQPDWHEHMIVERTDKSLWMLARTRLGIMESTSGDGGRSWSEPTVSAIKHPVARFHIRRLQSGRLLLVKHGDRPEAHEGRVQLSAWLSADDGQTWQGGLVLDERKGISYPDGFQAPDGTIYISYDRNRSSDGEILLARFTEQDILARRVTGPPGLTRVARDGGPTGPKSKLKMLISRPLAQPWQSLWNGKDLTGWHRQRERGQHGTGGHWTAHADGSLRGEQDPPGSGNGGLLLTDRTFGEFELELSLRSDWGPDSGVFLRADEQGGGWQIYVDHHDHGNVGHIRLETPRYSVPFRPWGFSRIDPGKPELAMAIDARTSDWPVGVYRESCAPAQWLQVWKTDDWNRLRVRCTGGDLPTIETWVNGLKVCHFDA
ncbi:MAG: exo-alpha-sialidase, partial [Planctomycetales bacterium]|nr:exo-alpha-sialidase [Planctomycetales bacterium]